MPSASPTERITPGTLEKLCRSMPIFPLPRVVLMPGALLPLHVFEHRYRRLVQHCLEGDRLLGVATLMPGYEEDYHAAPPVHRELGVGLVVSFQAFPDGRSNIVVQHVARATVVREVDSPFAFRMVHCRPRGDDLEGAGAAITRLKALILQLGSYSAVSRDEASRLAAMPGIELSDELARKLLDEPGDKRAYVALDRVVDRVEMITERLGEVITSRSPIGEA